MFEYIDAPQQALVVDANVQRRLRSARRLAHQKRRKLAEEIIPAAKPRNYFFNIIFSTHFVTFQHILLRLNKIYLFHFSQYFILVNISF